MVHYRRGCFSFNPSVSNGIRHYRVCVVKPIPSYLRFGKTYLRLRHDDQQPTCRKCDGADHFADKCTETFCFNCKKLGHESSSCAFDPLCCICKEPGHLRRNCEYSWRRELTRPVTIDESRPVDVIGMQSPQRDDDQSSLLEECSHVEEFQDCLSEEVDIDIDSANDKGEKCIHNKHSKRDQLLEVSLDAIDNDSQPPSVMSNEATQPSSVDSEMSQPYSVEPAERILTSQGFSQDPVPENVMPTDRLPVIVSSASPKTSSNPVPSSSDLSDENTADIYMI